MALSLDLPNILQFFSFLSPIIISSFLVLQSFISSDVKGIMWLVGNLLAYIFGILAKSAFHKFDEGKGPGEKHSFKRIPIVDNLPINPGTTRNNVPDYCSVFNGPFSNMALSDTSMPSLNAIFHSFTIAYIAMGVGENPIAPSGGITLIIVLGILAMINWFYRVTLYCDRMLDVLVGATIGAGIGVAWYYAIKAMNPTWVYFGKEKKGKCVLGEQKFVCTYEDA